MRKAIIVVMLIAIVVIIGVSLVYIDGNSRRAADELRVEHKMTLGAIETTAAKREKCRDLAGTPSAHDLCMALP